MTPRSPCASLGVRIAKLHTTQYSPSFTSFTSIADFKKACSYTSTPQHVSMWRRGTTLCLLYILISKTLSTLLSVAANLYKLLQLVLETNFHIHTEIDKIIVLYIFESLTLRLLMSYIYIYIYRAPILDVSRSHTMTRHSR